jgi:ribonuclease HI
MIAQDTYRHLSKLSSQTRIKPLKMLFNTLPISVFCNGSGFTGGIKASALLYNGNRCIRTLRYYLGTGKEHTVYEAEGIGLVMGLHLLHGLGRKPTHLTPICSDSQAIIRALDNQYSHPGQHILDLIHDGAEKLHANKME